jgi:hypothetical protein
MNGCFPRESCAKVTTPAELAVRRVLLESGIKARIIVQAGKTAYEFYSLSRQRPVANKITWYIMVSEIDQVIANEANGFAEGGFFSVDDAINMVTYSQDKSLLTLAFQKYKELA